VTTKLQELIAQGKVQPDIHQSQAAEQLDRIHKELMRQEPSKIAAPAPESSSASSSSFFGGLFGGGGGAPKDEASSTITTTPTSLVTTGAYMFGGVGCGKTFLMNLLYDSIDSGPWLEEKQKVHYHKFMLTVHQSMHECRKKDPQGDLIQPVVNSILEQGRFLCLDEFQVTDVADALILQRLFEGLWNSGCILVATSNRPPRDLYLNGLQRDRFIPFIDLLEKKCTVIDLLGSTTDYRMISHDDLEDGNQPVYYSKGQHLAFRELYNTLSGASPSNPTQLETQGRKVRVPLACPKRGLAKFSFEDLCRKALGAADYLVIGSQFSTVFCHDIPKLTIHHVNWLRRFITFVDTMYELKVTLILHTHAKSIDDIFVIENDKKGEYSQDEVFAFDRTRSRLEEMSSKKYLSSPWEGHAGGATKRKVDIPVSTGEDYGHRMSRPPPALPTLRATPLKVNQID
jgi:protein AFG1